MSLKFRIEQVALCAVNSAIARELLTDLGLTDWVADNVHARGKVFGEEGENKALLQFNYQSNTNDSGVVQSSPLELEILDYTEGANWMDSRPYSVSHLGMHCTAGELIEFRAYFESKGIVVAQEVVTQSHTNPYIANSRRYNYVIFDTRQYLGVDLKFIVRLPYSPAEV